jgi:hypothetical protein
LCETNERFSDEYFRRLKEESERFWGKRLTMPAESPRWPPKHDVLNYRIG